LLALQLLGVEIGPGEEGARRQDGMEQQLDLDLVGAVLPLILSRLEGWRHRPVVAP
jgi:hypothetical protein